IDQTARTVKELGEELKTPDGARASQARIPKVQVVDPPPNAMQVLRGVVGPVVGPLATGGLALVFLLFMLLERDLLRDRLIRLAGGDLHRTTQALSDATGRVSRYLATQLLVNSVQGALLAAGLYAIGVP